MAIKGNCLCGSIRYEINGELGDAMLCHCSICRKTNGSAYAINAPVNSADFKLLSGRETLASFESSEGAHRFFCNKCGAPIYSQRSAMPEVLRLRLGSLDDDVDINKSCHVFVASKANWDEIQDELPQYDERP